MDLDNLTASLTFSLPEALRNGVARILPSSERVEIIEGAEAIALQSIRLCVNLAETLTSCLERGDM